MFGLLIILIIFVLAKNLEVYLLLCLPSFSKELQIYIWIMTLLAFSNLSTACMRKHLFVLWKRQTSMFSFELFLYLTQKFYHEPDFVLGVCFRAVEVPKIRLVKRLLLQAPQAPFKAPIHSKYCNRGFSETGLALVVVLRCDWPLCDLRFKSYEHFKIKMFLFVHTAGPWWIF